MAACSSSHPDDTPYAGVTGCFARSAPKTASSASAERHDLYWIICTVAADAAVTATHSTGRLPAGRHRHLGLHAETVASSTEG